MNPTQRIKFNDMLWDYFALKLPEAYVNEILGENPEILEELEAGAITDTQVRDMTINVILSKLKMRSWPTYADMAWDRTLMARFDAELTEKVKLIGGEYFA